MKMDRTDKEKLKQALLMLADEDCESNLEMDVSSELTDKVMKDYSKTASVKKRTLVYKWLTSAACVALFLTLILFTVTSVFHLTDKTRYLRATNKAVYGTKENSIEELNIDMINDLPREALSVDTDWYEDLINENFGYRKSYKKMLDMIIGGVDGIPGFSLPTYISAVPLVYVRLINPNGDFYAFADDRNVTAYLLDENRQIIGYIELYCSRFGKVVPTLLVHGSGIFGAETVKAYPDERYIYIRNMSKTGVLNSKDKAYVAGPDVPKIEAGCYEMLYSEDLAISYTDICNNALPINW